jgi:hypothetical protein
LGLIVERLSAKTGATADELVEITGWRRPSVLGALSRLRCVCGFMGRDIEVNVYPYSAQSALMMSKGLLL